MPLDYLSCFTVALTKRNITKASDICQTDYSIYSKLSKNSISPYSEVIHRSTTFKLTKD